MDYILADNFEEYPRYPLDKGVPGGFPLLNFPDISMYGQNPWGGYGANPHPSRLQARWDETKTKLSGGFPYSEGIYEDLNKVICAELYWAPDRPALERSRTMPLLSFRPRWPTMLLRSSKSSRKTTSGIKSARARSQPISCWNVPRPS